MVTGHNVDNKNKSMLMEQFHEMLTRKLSTTRDVMERVSGETWETHEALALLTGHYRGHAPFNFCPVDVDWVIKCGDRDFSERDSGLI